MTVLKFAAKYGTYGPEMIVRRAVEAAGRSEDVNKVLDEMLIDLQSVLEHAIIQNPEGFRAHTTRPAR